MFELERVVPWGRSFEEYCRMFAPVRIPAADLKWVDLDPVGAPGVEIANLWGNPEKGAFGAFFKLPAGFAAPLHTHTRDSVWGLARI